MCLIVYKPKYQEFNEEILDKAWDINPHGAGFMTAIDGKLIAEKGYFDKKSFLNKIKDYAEEEIVIHFRWATHGKKDFKNCHPFYVTDDMALVHNGQIHDVKIYNKDLSDTFYFAQKCADICVVKPEFWKDEAFNFKLAKFVGKYNKIVFMDNHGDVKILNEFEGTWLDGVWYSNTRFLFGGWDGIGNFNERNSIFKKFKKLIRPYKVSNNVINKGKNWFFCDNCCYIHYGKEPIFVHNRVENSNICLCKECYKETGWLFEPTFIDHDLILDRSDVERLYKEEEKRLYDLAKQRAKKEKESKYNEVAK